MIQVEGLEVHPDNQKKYRCVCPTGYALKENSTTQCADGMLLDLFS